MRLDLVYILSQSYHELLNISLILSIYTKYKRCNKRYRIKYSYRLVCIRADSLDYEVTLRRSRLQVIKNQIFQVFEQRPQKVYTFEEVENIYLENKQKWHLPISTTLGKFLNFLQEEEKLVSYRLDFSFQPTTLFFYGLPTYLEIATRIRPQGYLSHFSALWIHDLIDVDFPKIIYVNDEQKPKLKKDTDLQQGRIDYAFRKPVRSSNNKITIGETAFYLLSGMNTGLLGVIEEEVIIREEGSRSLKVRVTNIERSLIDSAVRPVYAGGTRTVLEAYRRAANKISTQTLANSLQHIGYVYPYHQAVGFYLERSEAYSSEALDVFRCIPRDYDFYLDYEMQDPSYSKEWRIYYPKEFD
jgi:hypothetical protein